MIVSRFRYPKEVPFVYRSKKQLSILSVFNFTTMKTVHHVCKSILCFAGLWLNTNKLFFSHGFSHSQIEQFKGPHINHLFPSNFSPNIQ